MIYPLLLGIVAATALELLLDAESTNLADILLLILASSMTLTTSLIAASYPREQLRGWLNHYLSKWKSAHGL